MNYNFDELIERKNTDSSKWDNVGARIGNPDALPMWVADMDFRCPQPVIDAVVKKAQFGVYGYPVVPARFAEVTAQWQRRRHNWQVEPKDVVYVTSVIPAMFSAVQAFTESGDKVLLQRPVYYPFSHAVEQQGRIIENCPLQLADGRYEIDFDALERQAADPAVKLMLLCNPHNPVGRVFTREELMRIGEICCRHGVVIFSDEIHADFVYTGHVHVPLASISDEIAQNTVTAVAPSKTFNLAGMRTGAMIISNPKLRVRISQVLNRNRSALPSVLGLEAYMAAYSAGEPYLKELVPYLEKNIAYLDRTLCERMPRIHLIHPEGTYLMWLDCREMGLSNEDLDHFFTWEAAVALDKGFWFGTEGSGFMRMNIACPRQRLAQALGAIETAYQRRLG